MTGPYFDGYRDGLDGNCRQDREPGAYSDGYRAGKADRGLPQFTKRIGGDFSGIEPDDIDGLKAAFALAHQPATGSKAPEPIHNNERSQQRVLLTGLDCAPGQQDLFDGLDGA
ncbi:MAG TPA: hypothetical protein VGK58_22255 [Lacipirellulaceae bacterium]